MPIPVPVSRPLRALFLFSVMLGWLSSAHAETQVQGDSLKYWIAFVDKQHAGKRAPQVAIHDRAVLRRQLRASVPPRDIDVPISPTYLDELRTLGVRPLVESRWLNAASAYLRADQFERVERLPFVARVQPVGGLSAPSLDASAAAIVPERSGSQLDYGRSRTQLALMNAIPPLERGINGDGVVIGFLDTQFNFDHPALRHLPATGRLLGVRDFTGPNQQQFGQDQRNFHGLSVASVAVGFAEGTLIGPAYGAAVLAATTEFAPTETNQEEDNLVAGLEWLEAEGADVVNISLGYTEFDAGEHSYTVADLDGDTGITTRAVDVAASLGVVVVTSAGNSGCSAPQQCWYYVGTPADADSVIAVGAVSPDSTLAGFSSRGPTADGRIKPDISAMGVSVVVATDGGGFSFFGNGTSFASPQIGRAHV